MVEMAAMHIDGRDAGYDRHVDFENVPPPDLPLRSQPGNENTVETSAWRTDFRSVPAADLIKVHRRKFFTSASLQVP